MRFLLMHRIDERAPEWNPDQEFVARMEAFIGGLAQKGVLITGEGVHPSAKGALVRKSSGGQTTAVDGPFTETKEVIGGFLMINAADRAEAVGYAEQYAGMFQDVEVEVRQVVEMDEVPTSGNR